MKLQLLYPTTPNIYLGKSYAHINQHFGENAVSLYKELGLNGHNGLDLFATDGYPIYAAHDGVITFAGDDGTGGLGIVIRTNEKYEYEGGKALIKSIYWHLKKDSIRVKYGDRVVAGQGIALADNTGLSTNSHLHFGIKPIAQGEKEWEWNNLEQKNGFNGAIDPEPYLYFKERFNDVMKYGMSNVDIARLQFKLQELGFFTYPKITGFYGEITRRAVLAFQKAYRVASLLELEWVNGERVGLKTLAKLNNL